VTTVRCPKCGTINPDGRRRLARCYSCREALGKCRYCLYYDPRQLDCVHPSRRTDERVLDADEVLNCPEFATCLTPGIAQAVAPFLRTAAIGIAVGLALMFGLTRLAAPPAPPEEASLRTSVSAPVTVFREEELEIKVFVLNQSDQPAREVRVQLSGRDLRKLTCQDVDPPDCFEEAIPQRVSALMGDLGPGEITAVTFRFTSESIGRLNLAAYVTAANLAKLHTTEIKCEIVP